MTTFDLIQITKTRNLFKIEVFMYGLLAKISNLLAYFNIYTVHLIN